MKLPRAPGGLRRGAKKISAGRLFAQAVDRVQPRSPPRLRGGFDGALRADFPLSETMLFLRKRALWAVLSKLTFLPPGGRNAVFRPPPIVLSDLFSPAKNFFTAAVEPGRKISTFFGNIF